MGAIPGSAVVHHVYRVVTFKPHSDNLAKSYSARSRGVLLSSLNTAVWTVLCKVCYFVPSIVLVFVWLLSEQVF